MTYYDNVLELVGRTPMVKINRLAKGLQATLLAKLEYFNPGGSVKDRIAITMLDDAERRGLLKPGGTVVEATSGNTGLGLAMVCALRGYRCICTLPDKQSQEKIDVLKAFGAEVVVTPTAVEPDDPRSYYSVAKRLSQEIPNAYYPDQYSNPSNPEAHYRTTGPEIWEQTGGQVKAVVMGMGTGGTMTGVSRYLKEQNPEVKVYGVDPIGSIMYDYFKSGKVVEAQQYKIEGIGEDILPGALDFKALDEIVRVNDRDAFLAARRLVRSEGIFTGGSGGAAMWAALQVARQYGEGDIVVVLLPDTGMRYLSKVYSDAWMSEHQFLEPGLHMNAGRLLESKAAGTPPLASVSPEAPVAEAIAMLKRYEVSQLPVTEGTEPVGSFTEDQMIDLYVRGRDVSRLPVREIMGDPFPVVDEDTPMEELSRLLTGRTGAVLVRAAGGELGILTKFDLVHALAPR